jgi:hypothetical protein
MDDWPGIDIGEPAFAEIWTEEPAWRLVVANSVRFGEVSPLRGTGFRRITCQAARE